MSSDRLAEIRKQLDLLREELRQAEPAEAALIAERIDVLIKELVRLSNQLVRGH